MIVIVDYGLGNVSAFKNVYNRLQIPVAIAKNADDLSGATKLILPGVGSFDYAMRKLEMSGMRHNLERLVLEHKVPLLGVCVGMQMLANTSDEGLLPGLGWIKARVKKFNTENNLILPHMGWNDASSKSCNKLFENMGNDAKFYFLHSYYFDPCNEADAIGTSNYGGEFTCAVQSGNIFGVQFHPEKSHHFGVQLLKNFADI